MSVLYTRYLFYAAVLITLALPKQLQAANGDALSKKKQEKPLILFSHHPEGSPSHRWLMKVYQDLFNRVGLTFEVRFMPSARATLEGNKGTIDGQFARIYEYQNLYPNQLRVNVPVYKMTIAAFANKYANIQLNNSWQSFKDTDYRVEYMRGVVIGKQNLEKTVKPNNLGSVTSLTQGFTKLALSRSDVFIYSIFGSADYLASPQFANSIKVAGIMEEKNLFLYLHKSHQQLIPTLEHELKAMKAQGLILQHCLNSFQGNTVATCAQLMPNEALFIQEKE